MYGVNLECGIKSVKVRVKDIDGRLLRRCTVGLTHEFNRDIAKELGKEALAVLKGLKNFGIEKATLPIDRISALAVLTDTQGEAVEIKELRGVKATCTAPKDDGIPTILFEFDFRWQEDAWLFLGRNCSAIASLHLTKVQLGLEEPTSAKAN